MDEALSCLRAIINMTKTPALVRASDRRIIEQAHELALRAETALYEIRAEGKES